MIVRGLGRLFFLFLSNNSGLGANLREIIRISSGSFKGCNSGTYYRRAFLTYRLLSSVTPFNGPLINLAVSIINARLDIQFGNIPEDKCHDFQTSRQTNVSYTGGTVPRPRQAPRRSEIKFDFGERPRQSEKLAAG